MLALCLMLSGAYYAKDYAVIIGLGLRKHQSIQTWLQKPTIKTILANINFHKTEEIFLQN